MDSTEEFCCFGFLDEREDFDRATLSVLFLISLQLLAIGVVTEICLEIESVGQSVVHSNKWVLGLSFLLCVLVLVIYIVHGEKGIPPPTCAYVFVIWSLGVILTVTWITVLLNFTFLASLIVLLWVWIVSILVSGCIFFQPVNSYCTGTLALLAVPSVAVCLIVFLDMSIMEVSFAGFVSMLVLLSLLVRLRHCESETADRHVCVAATCILCPCCQS